MKRKTGLILILLIITVALLVCTFSACGLFSKLSDRMSESLKTEEAAEPSEQQPAEQTQEEQPEEQEEQPETPVHTHAFGDWVTQSEATCTTTGIKKRTCSCGEEESEVIDALGHDYQREVIAPTCTEGGHTVFTCSRCRDTYVGEQTDPLGHDDSQKVVTPATCTEGGYTTYTCSRCEVTFVVDETQALGHDYHATVTPATCTNGGYTIYVCSNCQRSYVGDYTTALGHSDDEVTVVPPTCTERGYTSYHCSRCNKTRQANYTDPIGHDYAFEGFVWTDYTARAQYICTHDETHVVSYKAKVTNAVTTQASCDHVGIRTYTATYDGHSGTKEQTIPMLDHTYGDVVAEIPATCEHEGRKAYRECTVCHTFFTKEGADWVPTEEADLVIPETHVYLFYEKQEETCSQDGRKAYYECSVCHELFSDESGEKIRVAEADLVIPASHDFVLTEVIEPTCTAQGYTVYTCTRCQDLYVDDYLPALGHDYVFAYFIWDGFDAQAKYVCTHDADHVLLYDAEVTSEITLAPTCTSTGIRTYTATYQEEGDVRTQTIEALPHTFDEIIAEVSPDCLHSGVAAHVTCSVCHTLLKQQGEALVPATEEELVLPALGHDYQADVTPPTCTQGGYTTYTCSRCSDSYEDDATAALGHDYQAVVTPATCTEDGFTTYTCSRCSDSYVGDETAALGHDYQAVVTPATCTTDGYTTYTCSRCNDVYVADHVDALGHDYAFDRFVWEGYTAQARYVCAHDAEHVLLYDAEVTSEITLAPTCTSTGIRTYTAVYQEEQDARTQVLDLLPHTLDEIVAEVSPDCLHSGTAEHVTCSVCHTLLKKQGEDWIPATEEDLVIPALGHDYQADVTPPTCTQGGYTTYTCSRCSDSYADDETAALGHDYQAVVTSATCTTDGYTTYTCSRCNDVYVADHVEALGHDFAFDRFVWDGYDAQAKYVCAHDAEHVLLFDAEVTSEVTLEPTCTTTGTRVYTATYETNVDQKIQTLDALGHDYGALIEEISPTCTETGVYAHYECANCHVLFLGQGENKLPVSAAVLVMPALGHDHQKSGVTEPTCTEQGYTTYSCTRCSDSYEADFVAPLGHDYQSTGVTAPTCTAQGYTTYQCSRCGDSYHDDHTDALGHSYLATEMVEAGCETSGYTIYECSRCHNTYHDDFTDPLGHKNKVKVTAPTCTEGGYTTYTCSRCKKVTIGDQTEPLGHDPVAGEVVPPTCSSEGYTVFTCSRCGLVYQGAFLPATEHDYVAGEVVPPTCSSMGYTVFTCSQCGDTYQGEFLPMIEHDYAFDSFVWEGYTAQAKLVCSSNAEHVTFVDATITSEVTVTPTCTATGIRVYTATYQTHSDTKEQSIAQTDHSYTELVAAVPATCVEEGVIAYCTCSVCGGYFDADHNAISEQDLTAPVDPDNHDWNDQGRCARCGEYFGTEGLVYTLNGNAYAITGYTGTDTEIYLPSRHEGKNVTTIAAYAFSERSDITFLRIPSGVTSIQDSAFSGCTRLVEVCNLSTLTI